MPLAFQCGRMMTARFPSVSNQRAFTRSLVGYGVLTGEGKRRKMPSPLGTLAEALLPVGNSSIFLVSRRKSVGFLYEKNSSLCATISSLRSCRNFSWSSPAFGKLPLTSGHPRAQSRPQSRGRTIRLVSRVVRRVSHSYIHFWYRLGMNFLLLFTIPWN